VIVAPDGTKAIAMSSFEGGVNGGVEISLTSGGMRHVRGWLEDYARAGWSIRSWHTELELLSRDELFASMRTVDDDGFRTILEELETRGFNDDDWPAYMDAMLDPALAEWRRRCLPHRVGNADGYLLHLDRISSGLGHDDPRRRLCAAWAMCEIAIDPPADPGEFDILEVARRPAPARDLVVAKVAEWWEAEKIRSADSLAFERGQAESHRAKLRPTGQP